MKERRQMLKKFCETVRIRLKIKRDNNKSEGEKNEQYRKSFYLNEMEIEISEEKTS